MRKNMTGSGGDMSVHEQYIPLDKPAEWKRALEGIKHSFGHTWENCYAMHLTTGLKTYLYCFESENVRVVCPVAEREYGGFIDVVKPFGFSGFVGNGDAADFHKHWKYSASQRGYVCGFLGLNPIFDYGSNFPAEEVFQYDTVHVFNLSLPIDQLSDNLHRVRQSEIRKWDKDNPAFVFEKSALAKFFVENYSDFLRAKGADSFYFFSPESLSYLMGLENIVLVGAQDSGRIIAVTVFAYTTYSADALFNVLLPEGRQYSVPLIWWGVDFFKLQGIPFLNIGGGGGGVGVHKQRYGGLELPLRCLKQIYKPGIYSSLCCAARVDPENTSGYFPAYRKPV